MNENDELLIKALERIAIALEAANTKEKAKRNPVLDGGAQKLAILWNQFKPSQCAKIDSLSPASTRYRNAKARWGEKPDEMYWTYIIKRLSELPFCLGTNDRAWVADFEFLVRPDSHAKILEGKYDKAHLSFDKARPVQISKVQVGCLPDGTPVFETRKN